MPGAISGIFGDGAQGYYYNSSLTHSYGNVVLYVMLIAIDSNVV